MLVSFFAFVFSFVVDVGVFDISFASFFVFCVVFALFVFYAAFAFDV